MASLIKALAAEICWWFLLKYFHAFPHFPGQLNEAPMVMAPDTMNCRTRSTCCDAKVKLHFYFGAPPSCNLI